jgi:hypothetical protein
MDIRPTGAVLTMPQSNRRLPVTLGLSEAPAPQGGGVQFDTVTAQGVRDWCVTVRTYASTTMRTNGG